MYFAAVIFLILGIISASALNVFDILLISLCLIFSNFICSKISKANIGYRNILFIIFFIGALSSKAAQSYELNSFYPIDDKFVDIYGYVYDIPQENEGKYTYIIRTDAAVYKNKYYFANENIKFNSDIKLEYAQNVHISGFLKKLRGKMNSNGVDYSRIYKSKRVFYSAADFETTTDNTFRTVYEPRYFAKLLKYKIMKIIDANADGDAAAILKAVTIGYKKDFSKEFRKMLYKSNMMKDLYPPSLHIGLIIFSIEFLMVRFKRKTRDFSAVIVLIIYAFFNSELPSVLNAALLAVTIIFARNRYGYLYYPDILACVVFIILLFNPLMIYHCGFVISAVMCWLFYMLREVAYDLTSFVKIRSIRRFLTFGSLSCIGVVPLSAYYFNNASIYSPLYNLIFFPLVCASILAMPLTSAEFLFFGKATLSRKFYKLVVQIILNLPYLVEKLPLSEINMGKPSAVTVILAYMLVSLIRSAHKRGLKNQKTIAIAVVLSIGFSTVGCIHLYDIHSAHITFVNVGQGDGALIQLPKGENILVDGGGSEVYSSYDVGENIFVPYLKKEGVFRIELAIITHFHKDHCQGILAAMRELNIKTVAFPDFMKTSEYRIEAETIAKEKGIEIVYLEKGDRITFKSGAVIDVIAPTPYEKFEENDTSIVFNLNVNGFNALFCGDATVNVEKENLSSFSDVDLIKVPHHGSVTSSSEEFINTVTPEYAVISVGEDNRYNLPDDEIVQRYEDRGVQVLKTSELEDIKFTIRKNGTVSYK